MRTRSATTLLVVLLATLATGCGTLPVLGDSDSGAIAFEGGELRSDEEVPLTELDLACRKAIEILGYEEMAKTQEVDRIHWKALTAGGDPVELQLIARNTRRTELRIRVGVFGNEARARLILEQIHQSL